MYCRQKFLDSDKFLDHEKDNSKMGQQLIDVGLIEWKKRYKTLRT